jgi:hypothetical protein
LLFDAPIFAVSIFVVRSNHKADNPWGIQDNCTSDEVAVGVVFYKNFLWVFLLDTMKTVAVMAHFFGDIVDNFHFVKIRFANEAGNAGKEARCKSTDDTWVDIVPSALARVAVGTDRVDNMVVG